MSQRRKNTHDIREHDAEYKEEKINELKDAIGPLSGRSLKYCTDPCLQRYLTARDWNVGKAKKMLEDSLKWRSAYKPEEICWNEVAVEGKTVKSYRASFQDREGRTVLVMKPAIQNTKSHDNQLRHLVYNLENAILNLPEGQGQMIWLIDFTGWSLGNRLQMKTVRESANILQNHYPERLAAAFMYNPPRIFEAFWKIVKYFLDPITFQKVKFIYPKNEESMELMSNTFDLEILPKEFGGINDMEFNHEEFSRMMEIDDIKTASMWGLDEKNSGVTDASLTAEIIPEPSGKLSKLSGDNVTEYEA